MENSVDFNRDLNISYLSLLAKYGRKEDFNRSYSLMEESLLSVIDRTTDTDLLNKMKTIIDYKKSIEKGMSK